MSLQTKINQYQTAQALLNEARYWCQVSESDSDTRLLSGAREVAQVTAQQKIKGIKIIHKLTGSSLKEAKDLWEYANWLNQQSSAA